MPVIMPCNLPPEIVFLKTTARLGPGDIAPIAQTKDKAKIVVKSIIYLLLNFITVEPRPLSDNFNGEISG